MERIGPTRFRILMLILDAQQKGKPAPSIAELARTCAIHYFAVQGHLSALKRDGLIEKQPFRARTLRARVDVALVK